MHMKPRNDLEAWAGQWWGLSNHPHTLRPCSKTKRKKDIGEEEGDAEV